MIIYWIIAFLIFNILYGAGTWQLYLKADKKAWQAFIPFYNIWVGLDIMKRPKWWIILMYIPIVMVVMWLVYWVDFARSYGKRTWTNALLMIVTFGLYSFYLNYIEKPNYTGPEERKVTFVSSLLFAIVLATIIHVWLIQPMIVPTGSMENTIRIGDALFVEKVSYGTRVPITPIALPFAELVYRNGFIDKARLPYMRIPGWSKLNRNDIVVFNYPADPVYDAIDRKDNYVKRLIGMPGDTFEIKNDTVLINGEIFVPKKDAIVQHSYLINSKIKFSERYLYDEFGQLPNVDYGILASNDNHLTYRFLGLSDEMVNRLRQNQNVISVERDLIPKEIKHPNIFPKDKNWNTDNYGPLSIPKKGEFVDLNASNIEQYKEIIQKYENHDLIIEADKIIIDGKETDKYTIEQDYFFMIGDNRNNSLDSRSWGYVPEDHIIGRPILVWANMNGWFEPSPNKYLWDRWMTSINNDNPDKKSYGIWVLAAVVIFFVWDYFRAKKKKEKEKNK